MAWPSVRSHVAILRGSHRPDALVHLTLFPPKAQPGEMRARNRYYLATVGQILGSDPALVGRVFGAASSFIVATGGKSLHVYFRLAEPITPERFTEFQRLVIAAYRHLAPEYSIYASLAKPAQVLLLAGGVHPRTGNLATIRSASGTTVDPGALEAALTAEKALWTEVA
ncbi:hypothetical protein [Synechococcus sp. CS-1333]|uniref:hypothetical protein n=1 Tax=Synechococcus sp. CS-1333 TaxID=2848638 RepID=UPI00223B3F77|nr:hypothetical protein [Synechococcus sp. CS-1333]